MDNFSEVYRIEAVAAILHAMALSENMLGETTNLNQGLNLLGEVLDEAAASIADRDKRT